MDTVGPTGKTDLDNSPPRPPNASKKMPPQDSSNVGMMGGSPMMLGLQYLQDAKKALLGLLTVFPDLTQILSPTVSDLEQLVTKALADKMSGLPPGGAIPTMGPPPAMGGPTPTVPPSPTGATGAGPMGM